MYSNLVQGKIRPYNQPEQAGTLDDDNNRRDKASMMSQLSQEFVIHMEKAEKCVKNKDLGRAEAHGFIAESIHKTLTTFEAIKE